jgi:hypothetical protein
MNKQKIIKKSSFNSFNLYIKLKLIKVKSMILIDKHIKNALHRCFGEESLRQCQISRQSGIQQASISRWLSGETKNMGNDNWFKIYPYIKKFLPEDYEPKDIHGNKKNFTINNNYKSNNFNSNNNINNANINSLEKLLLKYFRQLENEDLQLEAIVDLKNRTNKEN